MEDVSSDSKKILDVQKKECKDSKQNPILKSLSPRKNMSITQYKNFLDDIFRLEDVFNVGVTGPYGSGKSSTIESYKTHNQDKKFIHISLGKYDTEHEKDRKELSKQELRKSTKEIEGKIINQLLHQVEVKQIPQAFAKVKKNNSSDTVKKWSFLIPIVLVLILYVTMYNYWVDFVSTNGLFSSQSISTNPMSRVLAGIILIAFIGFLTYKFGEAQINRTIIRKISIRGNEIELYKNEKNSFFDEHLNEVVYLFENSKADVIVFEDLDRYNNPDVFRKLRELNQLINKRFLDQLSGQETKEKIVFLYLIKDDIFVSKDRAKFFDLIIPIVPVVTSSNSYNKILHIFENEIMQKKSTKTKDKLSKSFLRKLSLYLDDMRLIVNIYNEYKIYNATINTADLSADKLLAIITYKNIFPRDFSNLQYEKGFLYSLINKKNSLLSIKKNEISTNIENLNKEITDLEKEKINSITELQMIYLKTDNIFVNNKAEADYESRSKYVKEILEGQNLSRKVYSKSPRYNNQFFEEKKHISIDELLEYLEQDEEFQNRKKIIEAKINGELEKLKNSVDKLKLKIKNIEVTPISELYNQKTFQEMLNCKEYIEIKNNEYHNLISFLIKDNFIDETYNDYMNYFYNNDLRKEDTIFLRDLYAGKSSKPNYRLSSIGSIIEILDIKDYSRKGILNYNIFEYLIKNNSLKEMKNVILVASQEKNIKFIVDLYDFLAGNHILDDNEKNELWIDTLSTVWSNFYSNMINEIKKLAIDDITSQKRLIFDALRYLDSEQIIAQNQDKELVSYLAANSDILKHLNANNWNNTKSKLIKNLVALNTELLNFDIKILNDQLVHEIINENLYKLNYQNIENIARFKNIISHNNDLRSFKEKNLTYIMKSNVESLKNRISSNINEYIELYVEFSNGVIYDSNTIMLEVLNDKRINNIVSYLKASKHKINNIEDVIDKNLWRNLIESESVESTISNIINYYKEYGNVWKPELIDFVNRSQELIEVDYEKAIDSFGKINFFGNTVKLNELKDDRYKDIVGNSGYNIEDLKILGTSLDNTKIRILIDCSVLLINSSNLRYLREYYPDFTIRFALHHFEEYVELSNINFDEKEIIDILNSNIKIEKKERLLSKIDDAKKISIENFKTTSKILFNIIDKHLKDHDIPLLFLKYSEYDSEVRKRIVEIGKQNINLFKSNDCDKKLIFEILKSDLDINIRQKLLIIKVFMMNYKDILSLIPEIELSKDYKELMKGKWPKFQKTDINIAIINRLEEIGVISSQGSEDGLIIARGKRI